MAATERGKWARYVRDVLRADPGVWHEALEREQPSRVKYAQRRLKALGCEAVTSWHGLDTADLRGRWPA